MNDKNDNAEPNTASNASPPTLVAAVLRCVADSLEAADEMDGRSRQEPHDLTLVI